MEDVIEILAELCLMIFSDVKIVIGLLVILIATVLFLIFSEPNVESKVATPIEQLE